jgi:hypothetical protein
MPTDRPGDADSGRSRSLTLGILGTIVLLSAITSGCLGPGPVEDGRTEPPTIETATEPSASPATATVHGTPSATTGGAATETERSDRAIVGLFEGVLEGREIDVRTLEQEAETVALTYVSTTRTQEEFAEEATIVARGYASAVEKGLDRDALEVTVVRENGDLVGSYRIEPATSRAFLAGNRTEDAYVEAVLATLETPRKRHAVRIEYANDWSGTLSYDLDGETYRHSIEGSGQRTVTVLGAPTAMSVNAQKRADDDSELTVAILVDGAVVASETTEAGYGVAYTDVSFER